MLEVYKYNCTLKIVKREALLLFFKLCFTLTCKLFKGPLLFEITSIHNTKIQTHRITLIFFSTYAKEIVIEMSGR